MNTYELDSLVTSNVTFTQKAGGAPVDPTTIIFFVRNPAGQETSYSYGSSPMTRTGVGAYTIDFLVDAPGVWTYKWQGTGTAEVTTPDTLLSVNSSAFFS